MLRGLLAMNGTTKGICCTRARLANTIAPAAALAASSLPASL